MNFNIINALITRKSNQHKLAKNLVITTPNGIVEERFVKIGGIDQWITIQRTLMSLRRPTRNLS
jgi:hypothetical protein